MGNEGDLLGDFVDGFKEENPDVNITVTAIPWASAHDKIQTAIAAGTVPDVIQMGTTWMADFADAFAPVPENFDLSDFSAGPLEAGQVDGEQLGVPWYVDSHVLYYRTDIAEQAGWKFIQWMTEPETQIEWYKTATVLPSSQSAWEDEVLAGDEKLAAYGEQLKSTQAPPAVPTWAQVSAAQTDDMYTLPVALSLYSTGQNATNYSVLLAGAVLIITPILLLFVFLQRYFIQGVAMTGIK